MAKKDKEKAKDKSKKDKSAAPAETGELRKKLGKLRRKLKEAKSRASGQPVSPLAPAGFPELPQIAGVSFAAAAAGVRHAGRLDVMAVHLAAGTTLAGVFTRSATRSAAVLDCERKLARIAASGTSRGGYAILVNSGNANAFTGAAGDGSVAALSSATAAVFGVPEGHVLTASTGVIGEPLPHDRIAAALETLREGLSPAGAGDAARAIMTTDTFPKGAAAEVEIDGAPVRIAGFAKGSGMIAPDMATMLGFIFTDARISRPALAAILKARTVDSFNAITVDGDTSTSDCVLLGATGHAAMTEITSARSAAGRAFAVALGEVMEDLARQIVRDGEGARKLVEVRVSGARSKAGARRVAMAIANSPLVKTAIAGEDPNWGRIVMAVGKSGAPADRDRLAIRFGELQVAEAGAVSPGYVEAEAAAYMKNSEIVIGVDLGLGTASDRVWTCDLTHRYIDINADYRS